MLIWDKANILKRQDLSSLDFPPLSVWTEANVNEFKLLTKSIKTDLKLQTSEQVTEKQQLTAQLQSILLYLLMIQSSCLKVFGRQ